MWPEDPRWQNFWKNVFWFALTLAALMLLLNTFRTLVFLGALWAVALLWGGWLTYRLTQLLTGDGSAAISQARNQVVVQQAHEYRDKIQRVLPDDEKHRHRAAQLELTVERLVTTIDALAGRVSQFHADETIRRDLQAVPAAIDSLQERLVAESDESTRRQLERTLESRQAQLESLQGLEKMVNRAEIQVESTLSQLGTIYSQLLTGQSTTEVADYSRLTADVGEEVRRLEDQLEALREVKLESDY